jgi:hypothetical protein
MENSFPFVGIAWTCSFALRGEEKRHRSQLVMELRVCAPGGARGVELEIGALPGAAGAVRQDIVGFDLSRRPRANMRRTEFVHFPGIGEISPSLDQEAANSGCVSPVKA